MLKVFRLSTTDDGSKNLRNVQPPSILAMYRIHNKTVRT
jgi:hypothetical protein